MKKLINKKYLLIIIIIFVLCFIGYKYHQSNLLDIRNKVISEFFPTYNKVDDFFIQYNYVENNRDTIKIELLKFNNKLYINRYYKGYKESFSENAIISKDKIFKGWNGTFMNQWTIYYYKLFYLQDKFYNAELIGNLKFRDYLKNNYEISYENIDKEGINHYLTDKNNLTTKFFISKNDTLLKEYNYSYETIEVMEYFRYNEYLIPKNIIYENRYSGKKEVVILNKFSIKDSLLINSFKDIISLESSDMDGSVSNNE
ncbi:MAG TPA: hypothetical protein VIN73_11790 [Vicingaceae bacterium]